MLSDIVADTSDTCLTGLHLQECNWSLWTSFISVWVVWTLKKDFIGSNQRQETDEQWHSDTAAEEKQTRSHFKEPGGRF